MTITEAEFERRFGVAPQQDDLERVNCKEAGTPRHSQCGLCDMHKTPRTMCGCYTR